MNIMMNLLLVVSFLALTDAWWIRAIFPAKKYNLAAKGLDEAGQDNPAKLIIGALHYLNEGIDSLKDRVDMLEGQVQEIESVLSGQGGQEPGPEGTFNQEPSPGGQEPVRTDETAVRMLLQKLESRLEEKKSEQKQGN
ncbi:hypothetical protein CHS0354_014868 [Potamilus streckersoni]|uniref:Uncharacterized protein n=1 Tax=Potamilus streckersoni TaxID=2493646 RepID=A0AAE0RM10_9BIVA|nr:hypothetical protein CHS0354_014868 [Potamilus streckersoni]